MKQHPAGEDTAERRRFRYRAIFLGLSVCGVILLIWISVGPLVGTRDAQTSATPGMQSANTDAIAIEAPFFLGDWVPVRAKSNLIAITTTSFEYHDGSLFFDFSFARPSLKEPIGSEVSLLDKDGKVLAVKRIDYSPEQFAVHHQGEWTLKAGLRGEFRTPDNQKVVAGVEKPDIPSGVRIPEDIASFRLSIRKGTATQ